MHVFDLCQYVAHVIPGCVLPGDKRKEEREKKKVDIATYRLKHATGAIIVYVSKLKVLCIVSVCLLSMKLRLMCLHIYTIIFYLWDLVLCSSMTILLTEEVKTIKYLGANFVTTGQSKDEVNTLIDLARTSFVRLQKRLWSCEQIRLSMKLRIYYAMFRTILLFGYEIWPLWTEDLHQLEVFDLNISRSHFLCLVVP